MNMDQGAIIPFLEEHLRNDWVLLLQLTNTNEDNLEAALHLVIDSFQVQNYNISGFKSEAERKHWEQDFRGIHVQPLFDNLQPRLQEYYQKSQVSSTFLQELNEMRPLDSYAQKERDIKFPLLLSYHPPLSVQHMKNEFFNQNVNSPLIKTIFEKMDNLSLIR